MLPSIFGENLFAEFFNDAFDDSFFSGKNPLYGRHAKNLMKTDIKEHKNCYKIAVDLPGFKKDEIKVELKDGYLTVSAAKGLAKDEEDKGRFIRRERYAGACSRSFYVGDVTNDEIKCKFEFGVLTITLPKRDKKAVDGSSRIMVE